MWPSFKLKLFCHHKGVNAQITYRKGGCWKSCILKAEIYLKLGWEMKRAEEVEARKEEKHLTSKYSINNLISSVYAGDLQGEDPTDTLRSTSIKPTVLPKVYPHIFSWISEKNCPLQSSLISWMMTIAVKIMYELQWNSPRNLHNRCWWHFISIIRHDGVHAASLSFHALWKALSEAEHITYRWFNMMCVFISLKGLLV